MFTKVTPRGGSLKCTKKSTLHGYQQKMRLTFRYTSGTSRPSSYSSRVQKPVFTHIKLRNQITSRRSLQDFMEPAFKRERSEVVGTSNQNGSTVSVADLPEEILVYIFSFYIQSEGLRKFLDCVKRVCRQWSRASENPMLWRTIDCPNLRKVDLLRQSRMGHLRCTTKLNLRYYGKKWDKDDLKRIFRSCPMLKYVDLSNNPVDRSLMDFICKNCPHLESVRLRHLTQSVSGVINVLISEKGQNLIYLNLSNNTVPNANALLSRISESCCLLQEFRMTNIVGHVRFPVKKFQEGCPQLRVLELGSCEYNCTGAEETGGFPNLEVFLSGVAEDGGPGDEELYVLLRESLKLRKLDIRGCRVTCEGLLRIPACELKILYLARSKAMRCNNLSQVIEKWRASLIELDLSRTLDEDVIYDAISVLWAKNSNHHLRELDLSCTNVSSSVLREILLMCPDLQYLNIESCRYLPRGSKRVYRRHIEIRDLLKKLEVV